MGCIGSAAGEGDVRQLSHCLLSRQTPEGKQSPYKFQQESKILSMFEKNRIRTLK